MAARVLLSGSTCPGHSRRGRQLRWDSSSPAGRCRHVSSRTRDRHSRTRARTYRSSTGHCRRQRQQCRFMSMHSQYRLQCSKKTTVHIHVNSAKGHAPAGSVAIEIALIVRSTGDSTAGAPEARLAYTVGNDVRHALAVLTGRAQLAAGAVVRTCTGRHHIICKYV